MSKEKQARREKMEGKNAPGNIKKSNSTAAGSPDGIQITNQTKMNIAANMAIGGKMMNNPEVPMQMMAPQTSADINGGADNPYYDAKVKTPAMSTVMPAPVSGMQAFGPGVGLNGNSIIGMQEQPVRYADVMQMNHYNRRNYSTLPSPMGPIGTAATPAPGGTIPRIQQTGTTMPLEGVSSADVATGGVNMKTGKRSK